MTEEQKRQVREQALQLAASANPGATSDAVLRDAKRYYAFLTDEKPEAE